MKPKQTELPLAKPEKPPMPVFAAPTLPPSVPSIAEQCPALEWKVEELLGKTAREIRVLGFEIPTSVPDEYVLRSDLGIEDKVNISTQGHRTGLAWVAK